MNESPKGNALVGVARSSSGAACVRIVGAIDIAAANILDDAFARILGSPRPAVYVDLACIDFADATLAHFLYRIVHGLPAGTPVLLCRPTPMTGLLIELCALDNVAAVFPALPADFPEQSPL